MKKLWRELISLVEVLCCLNIAWASNLDTYDGDDGGASCYDCQYSPQSSTYGGSNGYGGFHRCALEKDDDAYYVNKWACQSERCFIRKDPNGQIYRGCADDWNLPWGVDNNVNCSMQGETDSIWWFCDGHLCNDGFLHDSARCGDTGSEEKRKAAELPTELTGGFGRRRPESLGQAESPGQAAEPAPSFYGDQPDVMPEEGDYDYYMNDDFPTTTTTTAPTTMSATVSMEEEQYDGQQYQQYIFDKETVHGMDVYDDFNGADMKMKQMDPGAPLIPQAMSQYDPNLLRPQFHVNSQVFVQEDGYTDQEPNSGPPVHRQVRIVDPLHKPAQPVHRPEGAKSAPEFSPNHEQIHQLHEAAITTDGQLAPGKHSVPKHIEFSHRHHEGPHDHLIHHHKHSSFSSSSAAAELEPVPPVPQPAPSGPLPIPILPQLQRGPLAEPTGAYQPHLAADSPEPIAEPEMPSAPSAGLPSGHAGNHQVQVPRPTRQNQGYHGYRGHTRVVSHRKVYPSVFAKRRNPNQNAGYYHGGIHAPFHQQSSYAQSQDDKSRQSPYKRQTVRLYDHGGLFGPKASQGKQTTEHPPVSRKNSGGSEAANSKSPLNGIFGKLHTDHSREPFWMWWWHTGAFLRMTPQEAYVRYLYRRAVKGHPNPKPWLIQNNLRGANDNSRHQDQSKTNGRTAYNNGHYGYGQTPLVRAWQRRALLPIRSNVYHSRISRVNNNPGGAAGATEGGKVSSSPYRRPMGKSLSLSLLRMDDDIENVASLNHYHEEGYHHSPSFVQNAKTVDPLDYKSYKPRHTQPIVVEPLGPVRLPDDLSADNPSRGVHRREPLGGYYSPVEEIHQVLNDGGVEGKQAESLTSEMFSEYYDSLDSRGSEPTLDGYNPCGTDCRKQPALHKHPSRPNSFIQCAPGITDGRGCECCVPVLHDCPQDTTFDEHTTVCTMGGSSMPEERSYKTLDD